MSACPYHDEIQGEPMCPLQRAANEALEHLAARGFSRSIVCVIDPFDLSHDAMGVQNVHATSLIALLEDHADRLREAIGAAPRGKA